MVYFDTAYMLKCYLNEPGAAAVRDVARAAAGLASSEFACAEFFSGLHRHRQENRLSDRAIGRVIEWFDSDRDSGVWNFFPVSPEIIQDVRQAFLAMPGTMRLRAGDAVHLATARKNGLKAIYTNDRNLLLAADHFGLEARNVIE